MSKDNTRAAMRTLLLVIDARIPPTPNPTIPSE
jgi:hypothetical protein